MRTRLRAATAGGQMDTLDAAQHCTAQYNPLTGHLEKLDATVRCSKLKEQKLSVHTKLYTEPESSR